MTMTIPPRTYGAETALSSAYGPSRSHGLFGRSGPRPPIPAPPAGSSHLWRCRPSG